MKAPYCCDRSVCNQGRACPRRTERAFAWADAIAAAFIGLCGCGALLAFFDVLTP